jgi:hypothetical protein
VCIQEVRLVGMGSVSLAATNDGRVKLVDPRTSKGTSKGTSTKERASPAKGNKKAGRDVISRKGREATPGVSATPSGSPRGTEVNLTTLDLTSSMTCHAINELSS